MGAAPSTSDVTSNVEQRPIDLLSVVIPTLVHYLTPLASQRTPCRCRTKRSTSVLVWKGVTARPLNRSVRSPFHSVRSHGLKRDPEVIVVDGGSTDRTVQIAKRAGAKVLSSARGRGRQLNQGWRVSHGDWYLFLHADNRLPKKYGRSMEATIRLHPRSSWGCFSSIQTDVAPSHQLLVDPESDK